MNFVLTWPASCAVLYVSRWLELVGKERVTPGMKDSTFCCSEREPGSAAIGAQERVSAVYKFPRSTVKGVFESCQPQLKPFCRRLLELRSGIRALWSVSILKGRPIQKNGHIPK